MVRSQVLSAFNRGYHSKIHNYRRSMGGQVPSAIDVYNPRLDTKVTIDIPGIDAEDMFESYAIFTRKNVIDICMDSLHNVPDWKYLMDELLKKGHSLELAWRSTANLDWVWLENDVTGRPRGWHVLCGLALRQLVSAFMPEPYSSRLTWSFHARPRSLHL